MSSGFMNILRMQCINGKGGKGKRYRGRCREKEEVKHRKSINMEGEMARKLKGSVQLREREEIDAFIEGRTMSKGRSKRE